MPNWIPDEGFVSTEAERQKAKQIRETLYPLASVTAAAKRLTTQPSPGKRRQRTTRPAAESWQEEAWNMIDLVGEFHFLTNTLANRVGAGSLYVGEVEPGKPTAEPVESKDVKAQAILAALGGNQAGRAQIIRRMAANLLVAGEGWFLGFDESLIDRELSEPTGMPAQPIKFPSLPTGRLPDLTEYVWRALSVSEVASPRNDNTIEFTLEDGSKIESNVDSVQLIRVWRPHDRWAWKADSAAQASLPPLRELVGLTMHVAAQVDSRLAGAGILLVKDSVTRAIRIGAGLDPEATDNPFVDDLIQAMTEPIMNRDIPAAVVPLVVTYPDEIENPMNHLSFATPLDAEVGHRREEAIRRFALSQDAPPEILLGTANMNHWGGWLASADTVTIHVEPQLALICDALTTQYLWPALIAQGYSEEQAERFVIWYSVDHLIVRPNLFEEARALYDAGLIDDDTFRRAGGFDLSDSPEEAEQDQDFLTEAIGMAMAAFKEAPTLAVDPGLPELVNQLEALLSGKKVQPDPMPAATEVAEEEPAGIVPTGPTTNEPPAIGEAP